jgi:serine/threonine protein phosphatase PrpC
MMVEGYCGSCGHKQPGARDHIELGAGAVVAITDRGIRHHDNEDAVAIATLATGGAVIVVCDGVSSTPGAALASEAAAQTARDLLVQRLDVDPEARIDEALLAATAAAQQQAARVPSPSTASLSGGPPSSTLVAAVARRLDQQVQLDVAWVGDSRAFWLADGEATALTDDHELGGSLSRWLGADSLDPTPELTHLVAPGPGRLVVCTDGLWRYADPSPVLARLVGELDKTHATTEDLAAALVAHALAGGGHDNITVAIWDSATQPVEVATDRGADAATDTTIGGDPDHE